MGSLGLNHAHAIGGSIGTASRRWESCPMRGLRLPEVAAGDFLDSFREVCELEMVELLGKLPPAMSPTERGVCIQCARRGAGCRKLGELVTLSECIVVLDDADWVNASCCWMTKIE